MKKFVLFAAAVAVCVGSVQAQGTFRMQNWGGPLGSDPADSPAINDVSGNPLPNESRFIVEALAGPAGGSLSPVATTELSTGPAPGFFGPTSNPVSVDSVDYGGEATVNVRVWDSNVGSSFSEALAAGTGYGSTGEFNVTLGGEGTPPGPGEDPGPVNESPAYLEGFQSFSLVPEPSTIALGLLGLGAFFLRRRMK